MWNSKLVNDAIFFATKSHDGQEMKHPLNMPYSAHFFGVTMNAVKFGTMFKQPIDWDLLICTSILHDTLEDTNATYADLENIFGKKIADAVFALTKDENVKEEQQMAHCIEKIKQQPKEVAIVKMADRMFNIRDRVPSWTIDKQEAYKQETKMICDALGDICKPLKKLMEEQIKNY